METDAIHVEESTAVHWVGSWRTVVIIAPRAGSHDDPRHIELGASLVDRISRRKKQPASLLFALPAAQPRPPGPRVRAAFTKAAKGLGSEALARVALVVPGSGFGSALHRAAITGMLSLIQVTAPVKVHTTFESALAFLLEDDAEAKELATRLDALVLG